MKIYIASDHAGFIKKNELKELLDKDYEVHDLGPFELDPRDDYPIYAEKVSMKVAADADSFGVLLCKSGEGMAIAANKFDGIRAALVWKQHLAAETRRDNNSNVVVFDSQENSPAEMAEMVKTFVETEFSGAERHERRLHEIEDIEDSQ